MNRSNLGWIVAAVLAVALVGVVVFQVGGDDGQRPGALGPTGVTVPDAFAPDVAAIQAAKDRLGRGSLPKIAEGQEVVRLQANPERVCNPADPPNVFAEWKNNPKSLSEAAGMAKQIVVATVQKVEAGKSTVTEAPTEPGGSVDTPYVNVTLRVDDAIKGGGGVGQNITIESLGDGAKGCFRVAGEPPYGAGQQFVLLLEDGLSTLRTIGPAGRFLVGAGGVIVPSQEISFGAELFDMKLPDFRAKLAGRS